MKFGVLTKTNSFIEEIEEALVEIDDNLETLEGFDWEEVFPNIEDTDVRGMVTDAIINIRINLRNLEI